VDAAIRLGVGEGEQNTRPEVLPMVDLINPIVRRWIEDGKSDPARRLHDARL
jgi:hypothetical protein